MELHGSIQNEITEEKNGKNLPHFETTKVVLVHCNIVNNDYQQDSRVLNIFVPNKLFGILLEIVPTTSEFQTIEEWFKNQNGQPLGIEDRINLTLVIKYYNHYKNEILN